MSSEERLKERLSRTKDSIGPSFDLETGLIPLLRKTRSCYLHPYSFFVSWQGVVTLAYRGFSPSLLVLKEKIAAGFVGLPPENPGSKWPKTTLGAVKDGKRLTPDQLAALNKICRDHSKAAARHVVEVRKAAVIVYESRSLERVLSCQEVQLAMPFDGSVATVKEQMHVDAIVREAEQPEYWFAASRDGNRASHYTGAHTGATLAIPLYDRLPPDLRDAIFEFLLRVEAELPDLYHWLNPQSWHVTIRALAG